jgi:hypothetical protein
MEAPLCVSCFVLYAFNIFLWQFVDLFGAIITQISSLLFSFWSSHNAYIGLLNGDP